MTAVSSSTPAPNNVSTQAMPAPFRRGCVIPAHPLALTEDRRLDTRRQRALTRYYLEAGAGGIAVGVHTTQFRIHDPDCGLLEPVLRLAAETAAEYDTSPTLVAGAVGPTARAVAEAELAASLGYHAVLLSPHRDATEDELVARAAAVGQVLPVIGFYLQPAVGGRHLSSEFWTEFAAIDSVVGIKVAAFNRYRTRDVVRGVCAARATDRIALYTGNDDHILGDLVSPQRVVVDGREERVVFRGGLLGHWSFWTHRAVEMLEQAHAARSGDNTALRRLLTLDGQVTEANAAVFDATHDYRGCVPGIHEVLRRQGLLAGRWLLNPSEDLSPGQLAEIDRVLHAYPELRDDDFVAQNLKRWLQ